MVLFDNVVVGQFVEVKHKGYLLFGTVRFKGYLNGTDGKWVGLELEYPFGNHNGCWRGRYYFKCKSNHGIFTHSSNIRFHMKSRQSRNNYHKVSNNSFFDQNLFFGGSNNCLDCYSISYDYAQQAKTAFENIADNSLFSKAKKYPLNHSISRTVPAATMIKQDYSQIPYQLQPSSNLTYFTLDDEFSPKPTIPHYTMPHQALKRQLKRGEWEDYGLHRPRFFTV